MFVTVNSLTYVRKAALMMMGEVNSFQTITTHEKRELGVHNFEYALYYHG